MNEKNNRWWLLAIPVGLVVAILIAAVAFQVRSGIRVTVESSGTTPLKSVVLHVTGASTIWVTSLLVRRQQHELHRPARATWKSRLRTTVGSLLHCGCN